jgi:hypothetical protein
MRKSVTAIEKIEATDLKHDSGYDHWLRMSGGRPEKLGTWHTTLENEVEPCVGDTIHDCHEVDPTLWEQFSCPHLRPGLKV